MEALTSRPAAGTDDLELVIDLLRACRAVEAIDPWPPLYEVRHHLRALGADQSAELRLWENRAGVLVAFATIWDGATLLSTIHPRAQCDDLSQQILAWGMARARECVRHCGEQAVLFVPIPADDRVNGALLERHGFIAEDWSILRMARPLEQLLPPPNAPDGFILRLAANEQELATAVAMHQGFSIAGPTIVRERLALLRKAADVVMPDLVAVAPDGELAAFCLCSMGHQDGGLPTSHEGWIDLLGTRPAYQRRGLGRAMVLAGLQQLSDHGAEVALLGTTSWNVAAQCLFESVGFRLIRQMRWYVWEGAEQQGARG
jgi:mycothiol synthase